MREGKGLEDDDWKHKKQWKMWLEEGKLRTVESLIYTKLVHGNDYSSRYTLLSNELQRRTSIRTCEYF